MPMRKLTWLSGAAVFSLLFAANAARGELESDGAPAGLRELAVSACAARDETAETQLCEEVRLRWRLCEQGLRSKYLRRAGIEECFLRSFNTNPQ